MMSKTKLLFLISLIIITALFKTTTITLAASPSFVTQQQGDDLKDWTMNKIPKILSSTIVEGNPHMLDINKSLCTNYSSYLPDITGVSYSSDGNTLKSIIWLNGPFENPSFNDDTSLRIRVFDLTDRIQNETFYHNYIIINFDKGHQKSPIEIINSTNKNGTTKINYGYVSSIISYIYTSDKGRNLKGIMLLKGDPSKKYVVTYETNANRFNDVYSEIAGKILQTFSNLPISKNTTSNDIWSGIKKQVPPNWIAFNMTKGNTHNLFKFVPAPLWIDVRFVMTIHVISFYGSGADYRVILQWDNENKKWTRIVEQMSPNLQVNRTISKILENSTVYVNFDKHGESNSYIDMSLNLSSIGFPDSYNVLSTSDIDFDGTSSGKGFSCSMEDLTNWVQLPPQKIVLSTHPSSLTLRPGDRKNIEVIANSSTNLDSLISLHGKSINNVTNMSFSPPNIYVPPYGIASSTLHVIASSESIKNENGTFDETVPIIGDLSLISGIGEAEGSILYSNSSNSTRVTLLAFLHITVANPTAWQDQIYEVFHTSASDISEFGGLITAIGTIVGSIGLFVGWIIKKKQKNGQRGYKVGSPL